MRWVLDCTLVIAIFVSSTTAVAGEIDPQLIEQLARTPQDERIAVDVVLRSAPTMPAFLEARQGWIRRRQAQVFGALAAESLRVTRRYENVPGFAALASRRAIIRLAARPEVERVSLDLVGKFQLAQGRSLVGADQAAALGYTGSGVTLAVVDSGVDAGHVDLASSVVAEECFCFSCCPNGQDRQSGPGSALDGVGHGTGVAGIISSDGVLAGPGVAPDAEIVAIKIGSASGSVNLSDVGAALDWLVGNHASLGVRVVNVSVSFSVAPMNDPAQCAGINVAANAIAALHAEGVAVFVASGNDGWDNGVAFPACVGQSIAVGAVYDASFGSTTWPVPGGTCTDSSANVDSIACLGNTGAPLDLLAPSWRTVTTAPGGVEPDFGGTSAASPYAAAQAALLLELDPSLQPDELRSWMVDTGVPVTRASSGATFPRADVGAALSGLLADIDPDADGILRDGDGSGVFGDNPCSGGTSVGCDDNCPNVANSSQADANGNGRGNACECGDLDDDGLPGSGDVWVLRQHLAGNAPLGASALGRCSVIGDSTSCDLLDLVVLARHFSTPSLSPWISQVCLAATGV